MLSGWANAPTDPRAAFPAVDSWKRRTKAELVKAACKPLMLRAIEPNRRRWKVETIAVDARRDRAAVVEQE
eukprot:1911896-Pyramimonas_sp.AAC.1